MSDTIGITAGPKEDAVRSTTTSPDRNAATPITWSSMTTAPRDGSSILLWDRYLGEALLAKWVEAKGVWGVEAADGEVSALSAENDPTAWLPVPRPPATPFRSRTNNDDGFPAWRSMSTVPRDGDILLTWHPDSGRVLLVLWDLGFYTETRSWCIEGAEHDRWDAAPTHGSAVAWMPAPFLVDESNMEAIWRRPPLLFEAIAR